MKRKIAFFDIDGTLTSEVDGTVPESAREAIRKARANGHLMFINTGRCFQNVEQRFREVGFDGYVCGCGTNIYCGEEEVLHIAIPRPVIEEILQQARKTGMDILFESRTAVTYDNVEGLKDKDAIRQYQLFLQRGYDMSGNPDSPDFSCDKFVVWFPEEEALTEFRKVSDKYFTCIDRGGNFREFVPLGYSKATGIQAVLDYYHLEKSDAYAFGDSNNDLSMLEFLDNSVAMGNTESEELLQRVSYVTKKASEDGIYHALKELGFFVERLRPECISCMLKQNLEKVSEGRSTEDRLNYMQSVLRILAEAPKTASAPMLVHEINALQKEMFGFSKDYTEIRTHFNQMMLEKEADIRQCLEQSEDVLKLAIQYAMMGNFIDFGAMESVDEEKLEQLLEQAADNPVKEDAYEAMKADLQSAEKLVYLTDNCGEIVLDKLLIQEMQKQYPKLQVTVIVKGGAVLNDATMEDAEQVGLTAIATVLANGNDYAGTCEEFLSQEALEELNTADVIISKGQANFETLRKCGRNIYYIFMCKCDMFARGFGVPKYSGILVNDKNAV